MREEFPRSIQELDFTPDKPVHPSPEDWRDHFIYFLLVDRFDNNKPRLHPYDGREGHEPREPHFGAMPQGGKLRGIIRRLPYLKKLGVTALWISPILKNEFNEWGTYHGYAIQNFLDVDPRIGTKKDLKDLVKKAHEHGIYIILDIVINHTGDVWAYENDSAPPFRHDGKPYPFGYWRAKVAPEAWGPDDAVWPAELQSPACFERRGGIVDWNNMDEAVHADFYNLKALNTRNHVVLETLIACYKYWIKEADIDGFRIDTVKHVEVAPAITFFNAIKEYAASIGKKNFFLFGEVIGGDDTLSQYVGRQAPQGERLQALDAALDFPLYFVLEEVIKGFASPELLRQRLDRAKQMYPASDATDTFVTFLDNHDQVARPSRRFLHGGADPRQARLGIGYLLTSPGIPVNYYGTEQGFDGGGPPGLDADTLIRENMFGGGWGAFGVNGMHYFNPKHPVYQGIAKIAAIRQGEPALRYGRMYFREISEDGSHFSYPTLGYGQLAYSRILDSTEMVVVLNLRGVQYANYILLDKDLTPPGTLLADLVDGDHDRLVEERAGAAAVRVTLPPYGMAILKKKLVEVMPAKRRPAKAARSKRGKK